MKRWILIIAAFAAVLATNACSTVKPWERGTLAEETMLPDAYGVDSGLNDHTYFSKEATNGGNAIGGGGCGCN